MSIYTLRDGTNVRVTLGQGADGEFGFEIDSAIDAATGEEINSDQLNELYNEYERELQQDWIDMRSSERDSFGLHEQYYGDE